MFLILIFTFTLSLAENLPEPCCSKKTVGDLSYTLVNSEDTSIAGRYGCKSNCVYQQDDLPGSLFCFADGDLPTTCADAVSVTAKPKPTTTTKSAIMTEDSYLYLTEQTILKLPSFEKVTCTQDFPSPDRLNRASAGVVTYNNLQELMVCGGNGMTGCRTWTKEGWVKTAETFPRYLMASSMTATGDWLWTGGYDREAQRRVNSTKLYTESGWQDFTELPVGPERHCQVLVENKRLYVIGGKTDAITFTDATYELTSSNEWSKLSNLNTQRYDHACVEWEGGILAIGGFNRNYLSSVEWFDPLDNKWLPFTSLPIPLSGGQTIMWKGDVFVFGGFSSGTSAPNRDVFKLQKGSKTWEVVPGVSVSHGNRPIYPAVIINNLHCNN